MIMKKMDMLYQKIANTVNDIIPEEWDKVFIYAEVNDDASKIAFHYYPKGKHNPINVLDIPELFDVDKNELNTLRYELYEYFERLWKEFKNNGLEVWTNLTFILERTGKFKIEYDYEDLSEADDYERCIVWEYKYLGILPEDESDREILKKYLRSVEEKEKDNDK